MRKGNTNCKIAIEESLLSKVFPFLLMFFILNMKTSQYKMSLTLMGSKPNYIAKPLLNTKYMWNLLLDFRNRKLTSRN